MVDDGIPHEVSDIESRHEVTRIFPEPSWISGQNTLARNLLAAIPTVKYDLVLVVENDDWYAPDYVTTMVARLDQHSLVGEVPARYYHVPSNQYLMNANTTHASLSQTGMRAELLSELRSICIAGGLSFIDIRLWNIDAKKGLYMDKRSVGIKGLPGRPGIGIGHRPEAGCGWQDDADGVVLRSWIGDDAELYSRESRSLNARGN